jgi:hypothetical protein
MGVVAFDDDSGYDTNDINGANVPHSSWWAKVLVSFARLAPE